MKAALPPPGTPVIDKNGLMNPDWYMAFLAILNRTGGTSDDLIARSLRVTNTGIVVATDPATGGAITRSIVGIAPLEVLDGSGVAGNPTLSLKGDVGMGLSGTGLYEDGEFLGSAIWDFDIAFPSTEFTSLAVSQFQAAADAAIAFKVGGVTKGTLTFLAGHTSGSVSWPGGYTLPADTLLQVYGPATHDATLSGITATIYGDRS